MKRFITIYFLFALVFLVVCAKSSPAISVNGSSGGGNSTNAPQEVAVPIIMYHGLTTKYSMVNDYFIMRDSFEADLKYLKDHGYKTVTTKDLINFVNGEGTLPAKPVVLTFDDGYCNNYNLAQPLLKKYNMKAIVSLIGSACQEASDAAYCAEDYCNMTWEQVEELADSGHWEIANHTWDLHTIGSGRKGASAKSYEKEEDYRKLLKDDLSKVQSAIKDTAGYYPIAFAWPFGALSEEAGEVFKDIGIQATFTSYDGINTIKKGDPDCLLNLKRQLRTPKSPIYKLLSDS